MGNFEPLPDVINAAIEAHGGATVWSGLAVVEATVSASGFLFTAKRRPALRGVRVTASAADVRFAFHDYPGAGETSELIGDEQVRVVGQDGSVLACRDRPRSAFGNLRRSLYWDHLDFVYFGGYALWNYLTTPFLFLRGGFAFDERPPLQTAEGPWRRIRVTFPSAIPTHSRVQDFYFDGKNRLRRLDYTADVVGPWAHAAHMCEEYRDYDGLRAPTRRRVLPLPYGTRPLSFPILVAIEVHHLRGQRAD